MSGFEPGEGWREVAADEAPHKNYLYFNEDGQESFWVREAPLPTEPWTVIRGTMPSGGLLTCILNESGQWWDSRGIAWRDVRKFVDGFEVLAEPRAVTAKAVIEQVLHLPSWGDGIPIINIAEFAREMGVTS